MKKLLFIFILIVSHSALNAGTALTLSEAIKKGVEHNHQVLIEKKNYEIAENNDHWGTVGRWPNISAGITNVNRYDDQAAQPGPGRAKSTTHSVAPFLSLNWLIFDGYSIGINKDNLELYKGMAKGSEIDAIETTVQDIVTAYYTAVLEKEKLKVLEELKKLSRDRYENILLKQEIGNAVTFQVLQDKNSYLNDSVNYIGQQINYKSAIRTLAFLLGEGPESEFEPTDDFNADIQEFSLEELTDKMLANNRGLKNMQLNQKVTENNIDLAKSGLYPSLALSSGVDYSNGRSKVSGYEANTYYTWDAYANLTLSIDLYNGGTTSRAIQNAQIEEEIGRLQIDELKLNLKNTIKNLYDLYILRKELYKTATENKESAMLNLRIAREKYNNGTINSFNFRDIQLVYQNAATSELEAIYNLIATKAQIYKLTGEIISKF